MLTLRAESSGTQAPENFCVFCWHGPSPSLDLSNITSASQYSHRTLFILKQRVTIFSERKHHSPEVHNSRAQRTSMLHIKFRRKIFTGGGQAPHFRGGALERYDRRKCFRTGFEAPQKGLVCFFLKRTGKTVGITKQ